VPTEIDPSKYESLVALLEESFAKFRDRRAFVCMDKWMTYGELDAMSRDFAAYLQSTGLKFGDRVAVMMPNILQYPVTTAGILRAGMTVVNVNPLYTPRELEHQLNDSGAEAIVILENFATTLEKVLNNTRVKHVILANMGDMLGFPKGAIVNLVVRKVKKMVPAYSLPQAVQFKAALAAGKGKPLSTRKLGPDDVAFLQYTGGTTGVSKGATLLHRNIVANVLQNDAWLQPALSKDPKVDQLLIVTALPLYHIFALTACFLLAMRAGGACLLIPNPRDIPAFVKELQKYKPSMFPAVNTLYNALLNHPDFGKIDFSQLKASNGGGMAVQRAVADRWLKATGCPVIEGYGLSETSPTLTCNTADSAAFSGTIGLPVPSTEISIRDDAGNELPVGSVGEICARGPQVMAGYWQRPEETAQVMTKDGFFRTGDIGVMDDKGLVKIVDRKKDMVLVSGFNVYPN
jgi:long-chain acyl-CoA synthetase